MDDKGKKTFYRTLILNQRNGKIDRAEQSGRFQACHSCSAFGNTGLRQGELVERAEFSQLSVSEITLI